MFGRKSEEEINAQRLAEQQEEDARKAETKARNARFYEEHRQFLDGLMDSQDGEQAVVFFKHDYWDDPAYVLKHMVERGYTLVNQVTSATKYSVYLSLIFQKNPSDPEWKANPNLRQRIQ